MNRPYVVEVTPPSLPDISTLDARATLDRKREVQSMLGLTSKGDPIRPHLKRENEALDARLRAFREDKQKTGTRRFLAGLDTPFYEAVTERLSADVVSEIERVAMEKLDARERGKRNGGTR